MFLMAAKLFLPRFSLPPLTTSVHRRTITAPSSLKRSFPFRRGLRTKTNMGMPKSSEASTEAIGGLDEEYEFPPEYYDDEDYELPPEFYDDEEFRRGVRTNTNMGMPKSSEASTEAMGGVDEEYGLPPEYYDDEWQARQREKTKELHWRRQEEDEEENRKVAEYREIGSRLMGYPQEEVIKARKLVSSFIRSAEEIEEEIEKAADRGELNELVLMVIWNRLDLARRDDEKDAIRSLDLLYRRVETEILKREATPSMRLLNDLLNLYDGFDDEEWLKQCRKCMVDTFPREDPFSLLVPTGMDINTQQSRIGLPAKDDDVLLRVDFIREVNALIQEVRSEQSEAQLPEGFDPESVAARLKQQEKQRTLRQIEALLDLALTLKW